MDDCSLYFINNGSVEIYLQKTDINENNVMKVCRVSF